MRNSIAASGVALALVFTLAPQAAYAASLTPLQISAIVSLLQAFGVAPSVIATVQSELSDTYVSSGPAATSTSAGVFSASAAFNASSLTYYLNVSSSGSLAVSGTASGVSRLLLTFKKAGSTSSSPDLASISPIPVVGGKWSVAVSPANFAGPIFYDGSTTIVRAYVPVGAYVISIFNADQGTLSAPLATGTLTVK